MGGWITKIVLRLERADVNILWTFRVSAIILTELQQNDKIEYKETVIAVNCLGFCGPPVIPDD